METTDKSTKESSTSEDERCACGQEGCLGHERIGRKVYVPGFTSEEALKNCKNEVVVFDEPLKQHIHDAVRKQSAS